MFSIGDFAQAGQVSVRMLRHYDQIGLLRPARVDPRSGYRFYEAAQLHRLNRLVVLKDLGFSLETVRTILDDEVDAAELRGMLLLRRAELAQQIAADGYRLRRVEVRLRTIESEGRMSSRDVIVKSVEPVVVAEVSALSPSDDPSEVGPVVQALYERLTTAMVEQQIAFAGPGIAYYRPAGDGLEVHAGCEVTPNSQMTPGSVATAGIAIVELPGIARAATLLHVGVMDEIITSYAALGTWIEEHGYRTDGTAREVYLTTYPLPQQEWRTEIQMPIVDQSESL
jgi:DNA-binding transcriptional MerR regulator/effector-binding domain-containing protein